MPSSSSCTRARISSRSSFMIAANGFEPELRYQHELLMSNCSRAVPGASEGPHQGEAKAQLLSQKWAEDEAEKRSPRTASSPATARRSLCLRQADPLRARPPDRPLRTPRLRRRRHVRHQLVRPVGVELGKELATGLLPVVQDRRARMGWIRRRRGWLRRCGRRLRKGDRSPPPVILALVARIY